MRVINKCQKESAWSEATGEPNTSLILCQFQFWRCISYLNNVPQTWVQILHDSRSRRRKVAVCDETCSSYLLVGIRRNCIYRDTGCYWRLHWLHSTYSSSLTNDCKLCQSTKGTVEMSRKKKIQITSKPDIYYPDTWNIGKKIPCIFCQLLIAAVLDLSWFYCSLRMFSIMANDDRSQIKHCADVILPYSRSYPNLLP